MRHGPRQRTATTTRGILLLATLALVCFGPLAKAQPQRSVKKSTARVQFERAEKLRTALQGKPQKDRTVTEYKAVVAAYRRVYLITPQAVEVTPALVTVAETYQEMGRLFDPKYYQAAIDAYQF